MNDVKNMVELHSSMSSRIVNGELDKYIITTDNSNIGLAIQDIIFRTIEKHDELVIKSNNIVNYDPGVLNDILFLDGAYKNVNNKTIKSLTSNSVNIFKNCALLKFIYNFRFSNINSGAYFLSSEIYIFDNILPNLINSGAIFNNLFWYNCRLDVMPYYNSRNNVFIQPTYIKTSMPKLKNECAIDICYKLRNYGCDMTDDMMSISFSPSNYNAIISHVIDLENEYITRGGLSEDGKSGTDIELYPTVTYHDETDNVVEDYAQLYYVELAEVSYNDTTNKTTISRRYDWYCRYDIKVIGKLSYEDGEYEGDLTDSFVEFTEDELDEILEPLYDTENTKAMTIEEWLIHKGWNLIE